jgi:hypothetical protein
VSYLDFQQKSNQWLYLHCKYTALCPVRLTWSIAMKNLPMDLLRTFVTITDLGGFTQAGEALGRSQPAISLQIKRLEEMIDEKLGGCRS